MVPLVWNESPGTFLNNHNSMKSIRT
jgi:hypothetical protein